MSGAGHLDVGFWSGVEIVVDRLSPIFMGLHVFLGNESIKAQVHPDIALIAGDSGCTVRQSEVVGFHSRVGAMICL